MIQCPEEACNEFDYGIGTSGLGSVADRTILDVQGQRMKKDRKFENTESGEGLKSGTFYKDGFNNKNGG